MIEAYYNEPTYPSHSLWYQPETDFTQSHSRHLDGTPSQAAKDELNMTITRKAAEIMVKESMRAAGYITILVWIVVFKESLD